MPAYTHPLFSRLHTHGVFCADRSALHFQLDGKLDDRDGVLHGDGEPPAVGREAEDSDRHLARLERRDGSRRAADAKRCGRDVHMSAAPMSVESSAR
jgi:hypothetical protein